jgi:membrane fusion protein, heavy metal efflux system
MNSRNKSLFIILILISLLIIASVVVTYKRRSAHVMSPNPVSRKIPEPESNDKQVHLNEAQMERFGVVVATAGPGKLQIWLALPGEIIINSDQVAHVVPRVTGVVREVRKALGDSVAKGEVMAILESRELADAQSAFLAARQRLQLAENSFSREEQLWARKISAEQDYLQAKNVLAEARIDLESAKQKLHALSIADSLLDSSSGQMNRNLTRYEIVAPISGTIVEKHIDLGEVLKDDTPGFKIADLSTVWANLDIQQRDSLFIQTGQPVKVSAGQGLSEIVGRISYVEPMVNEQTRTTHARVVLENRGGKWRPGLFITGRVKVQAVEVAVLIPQEALIMIEGQPHVFIKKEEGFIPQPVATGRSNETQTEILSGLRAGQVYVWRGAFTLKSELDKPESEE